MTAAVKRPEARSTHPNLEAVRPLRVEELAIRTPRGEDEVVVVLDGSELGAWFRWIERAVAFLHWLEGTSATPRPRADT